jgi:GTP diphosphokinase / guanosine-3',5'-bis(diphosphate) 3'-diphosphatase
MIESKETLLLLKAISFAADKHRFQKRKDSNGTPYINHPIDVALTLMQIGKEKNINLLIAAVLHDTIEDTKTTPKEIKEQFGKTVLDIVIEVTDDKGLPKAERKKLQITNAPHKSTEAKKLKLADKICNISDIIHNPPEDWSAKRKREYVNWVEEVMQGLKGSNAALEKYLTDLLLKGKDLFRD